MDNESVSEKLATAESLLREVMEARPNYSTLVQAVYYVSRVKALIDANKPEQIAPIRERKGRR